MAFPNLQTTSGSVGYSTAANWSTLTAPTTGDAVTIANSAATIDTGLYNTATLASLVVPLTFTGTIGLASSASVTKSVSGITRTSTTATATSAAHGYSNGDTVVISGAGESDYNVTATISNVATNTFDYTVANSPTTPATGTILVRKYGHLVQPATLAQFGAPSNNSNSQAAGSGRIKWDAGSVATTITVLATTGASPTDANTEPLRIVGTHASNVLNMLGGLVGLATSTPSEVATFATINQTGGTLNAGAGVTWTTVNQSGGVINLYSGAASGVITQAGGNSSTSVRLNGSGTIQDLTVGANCVLNLRKAGAGDTVTGTLTLNNGAVLDLTGNPAAISIATLKVNGTATIRCNPANPGHVTWTTLNRQPGSRLDLA